MWRSNAPDPEIRRSKRPKRANQHEGRPHQLFNHIFCCPPCLKNIFLLKMVSLEPVEPIEEPVEEPTEEPVEEPEPAPTAPEPEQPPEPEPEQPQPEQPTQPAPKRRGRPKKDPSKQPPKQAVRIKKPPPVSSSSEEEPMSTQDMETVLLDYLYRRKTAQQNARRARWSQLAGLI